MISRRLIWLALGWGIALPAAAQTQPQTGFRAFLHRTANAITGQSNSGAAMTPTTQAATANTNLGGGLISGTLPQGQAVTDGPVYRPQGGATQFKGLFDGYSIATAVPRGTYPRVALTFGNLRRLRGLLDREGPHLAEREGSPRRAFPAV